MELVVVSLPSDKERRVRLEASLAPFGLSYHWLKAVDARGWQADEMAAHMNRWQVFYNMSYHPNPGAIGCHLSHMNAFTYLLESNAEAIIILEDDAEITDDFVTHLPCLRDAMSCLDIVFLCDRRANRQSALIGSSQRGLEFRFKRFANVGTNGYVINRKAASFMLANHQKFGLEIDMLLNRWWQSGLFVATTGLDLVTHNDMGSSIGYNSIKTVKNPLRRLAATLYRSYFSMVKRLSYKAHHKAMKTAFERAQNHD